MQAIITERDKLRGQLNALKSQTQVTVDRRPLGAMVASAPDGAQVTVLSMAAQLTRSEREALQKAVSADYLEERGMREGTHGEILNDRGRTLFEVGFTRAIRKVLGE
jgi:hypothetical protein